MEHTLIENAQKYDVGKCDIYVKMEDGREFYVPVVGDAYDYYRPVGWFFSKKRNIACQDVSIYNAEQRANLRMGRDLIVNGEYLKFKDMKVIKIVNKQPYFAFAQYSLSHWYG